MLTLRNAFLATVAVGALVGIASPPANATPPLITLTLNPAATNGGAGSIYTGPGSGAFQSNQGAMTWLGNLGILSEPGTPGPVAFNESVTFWINSFALGNSAAGGSVNGAGRVDGTGGVNTYYILGTLNLSGSGAWASPNLYVANPAVTASLNLYGLGGVNCSNLNNCIGTPTTSTASSNSQFGLSNSITGSLIHLASGTYDPILSEALTPEATALLGSNGTADEDFAGAFTVTPDSNAEGTNGFFQLPPEITFDVDSTINTGGSVTQWTDPPCTAGSCTDVTITTPGAGGNLYFYNTPIPEPASLTLFGAGLLGLGAMIRRKRRKS